MTRDEAIAKAHESYVMGERVPETFVRLAVGLGMLKLEEPKSPKAKLLDALATTTWSERSCENLLRIMDEAGLKIVEK